MLTLGMIGGGQGAFIGAVHRMAAALDGSFRLVAGALASTPEKSLASARELGLAADRSYPDWRTMLKGELSRDAADRIDAVSIVTPNATHFEIALAFIEAGFAVICDKPMVVSSEQAKKLIAAVERMRGVMIVTYNYTGYPMVKEAASLVRGGGIGEIRKVFVEYHQGWLASAIEKTDQKQASWRQNPAMAGGGGAIGDIGTHAENLVSFVTGLEIESLCADLTSFVPGRTLDDDAAVLLRFRGGAKGVLTASQVCIGEQNALTLRVHGTRGSIAWKQEEPNALWVHREDRSEMRVRGVRPGAAAVEAASRIPPGHPEGFIEAFANIYRGAAEAIRAKKSGGVPGMLSLDLPTVHDGARGVRFVEAVVASGGRWVGLGEMRG